MQGYAILPSMPKKCVDDRIVAIIGGLHLLDPPKEQLTGTIEFIRSLKLNALYACHCTDFDSKCALAKVAPVEEVGGGLCVEF